MLCEKCASSEATFHLTEINNNVQSELHLCMKCAKNIELNPRAQENALSVKAMFSFLNDESMNDPNNLICLNCGLTGIELSWGGRPGCPSCYKYFNSIFEGAERKNKDKYNGKKPANYIEIFNSQNTSIMSNSKLNMSDLEALEDKLRAAVLEERYEEAAELRDRIREVRTVE